MSRHTETFGLNAVAWIVWLTHANYARGLLVDSAPLGITSIAGLAAHAPDDRTIYLHIVER